MEAGLAIAELLASLSKPTVSIVLGGGHSIGVPIGVACDYSIIAHGDHDYPPDPSIRSGDLVCRRRTSIWIKCRIE